MRKSVVAALAGLGMLLVTAGPVQAGVTSSFWGNTLNACGGSNFETCASVELSSTYNSVSGNTEITLTIWNTGSSGEVFNAIGLMGLPSGTTFEGLLSAPAGWDTPANELAGDGLVEVVYGANAPKPAPQNGLANGEGPLTFTFAFSGDIDPQNIQDFGVAVHAISGPNDCSTKLGIYSDGSVTRTGPYDPDCVPTNVVPEPLTMVLLGTGLAGIAGVAHRRRREDEVEEEEAA